ncbi:MAG: nucleoside triphosphate pyrophosphohydrolase, partial [Planctomycetes bacterium]|nr:nucleoside triphosphate pyrophosphohydrolase [Planctomycetota bacterium]
MPAVPPPPPPGSPLPGLQQLVATVGCLRAPDGCPWDRKQTTATMAPHLLEEAFEAADALGRAHDAASQEELGDVLVNLAMIGQIAGEAGRFDLDRIAAAAAAKLVRRHPHVFGDRKAESAELAYANWEQEKQREKAAAAGDAAKSVLAGVPTALPALLRAFRTGEKAARSGFDWPDRTGPRAKIDEELRELDEAIAADDKDAMQAELGDVLFSLCNLARHLGVNPEMALAGTVRKFQRRFVAVEREFGFELRGRTLAEMDAAWNRAKASER